MLKWSIYGNSAHAHGEFIAGIKEMWIDRLPSTRTVYIILMSD